MKKLLLAGALVGLVGCGQYDPPAPTDVQQHVQWFTLKRPDGRSMQCVMYGSGTEFTNNSKSWFSFTCDWSPK